MEIVILVGLSLICLLGVVLTVVRLPGPWLIVGAGWLFCWYYQWQRPALWVLIVLTAVAAAGEVIEMLTSAVVAKKGGASKRALWGGLIGGFVGMFVFTIPLPIIGTTIGALLGCFAGAAIAELTVHNRVSDGVKVGTFSAIGFAIGVATKLAIAMMLSVALVASAAWPSWFSVDEDVRSPDQNVEARSAAEGDDLP